MKNLKILLAMIASSFCITLAHADDEWKIDCEDPEQNFSTPAMRYCAGIELTKTEEILKAKQAVIRGKLEGEQLAHFEDYAKAAAAQVEAKCLLDESFYLGGTIAPIVFMSCSQQALEKQIEDIEGFIDQAEMNGL